MSVMVQLGSLLLWDLLHDQDLLDEKYVLPLTNLKRLAAGWISESF